MAAFSSAQAFDMFAWGNYQYSFDTNQTNLIDVVAGQGNVAAVRADGTVKVWGSNVSGQTTVPAGLSGVVQVATNTGELNGKGRIIAVKSDGTIVVWGDNTSGAATPPAGLTGVVQAATGVRGSLALKSDGTVTMWGAFYDGTTFLVYPPTGLADVTQISVGDNHALALRDNGKIVAWGNNTAGQCDIPVGLTGVVQVVAGGNRSMALKSDGTVVCWGSNLFGVSRPPAGLTGVRSISGGSYLSGAIKADGSIVMWGYGNYGARDVPPDLRGVVKIACGPLDAVAIGHSLTFSMSPANFISGSTQTKVSVKLTTARTYADPVVYNLNADPALGLPSTLTLPAGSTTVQVSSTVPAFTGAPKRSIASVSLASKVLASKSISLSTLSPTAIGLDRSIAQPGEDFGGTIVLNAGPKIETQVQLTSSNPSLLAIPSTVTVVPGATSSTFPYSVLSAVTHDTPVTITASLNGAAKSTVLTITPAAKIASISGPAVVYSHQTPTYVVSLNKGAPQDGLTALVTSTNTSLTLPTSAYINPSTLTASVTGTVAIGPTATGAVTFTVTGSSKNFNVKVVPNKPTLVLSAASGTAADTLTGTVTLTAPVDIDTVITLIPKGNLTVPATVTILAGNQSATFSFSARVVTTSQTSGITARLDGHNNLQPFTVNP